jgi:hypothetical protein
MVKRQSNALAGDSGIQLQRGSVARPSAVGAVMVAPAAGSHELFVICSCFFAL